MIKNLLKIKKNSFLQSILKQNNNFPRNVLINPLQYKMNKEWMWINKLEMKWYSNTTTIKKENEDDEDGIEAGEEYTSSSEVESGESGESGSEMMEGEGIEEDQDVEEVDVDLKQKIEELKNDIRVNNNVQSMLELGRIYVDDDEIEIERGIKYYKMAAKRGNTEALNFLGDIYFDGDVVEQNSDKAIKYYTVAAESGDAEAMSKLGYIYLWDESQENADLGLQYLRKAESLNDNKAIEFLGLAYSEGQGVEKNIDTAIEYFEKLSKMGDPAGTLNIASIYVDQGNAEKAIGKKK